MSLLSRSSRTQALGVNVILSTHPFHKMRAQHSQQTEIPSRPQIRINSDRACPLGRWLIFHRGDSKVLPSGSCFGTRFRAAGPQRHNRGRKLRTLCWAAFVALTYKFFLSMISYGCHLYVHTATSSNNHLTRDPCLSQKSFSSQEQDPPAGPSGLNPRGTGVAGNRFRIADHQPSVALIKRKNSFKKTGLGLANGCQSVFG